MAAGAGDDVDQGAGTVGPPPGMVSGAAALPAIPADTDYDVQAMSGKLGQMFTAAQQASDAKLAEIATCLQTMSTTVGQFCSSSNAHSKLITDLYGDTSSQLYPGSTSGKGKGASVAHLKSELTALRADLTLYDSQLAGVFGHIDQKFAEVKVSDTLVKRVIEKVIAEIKGKFDENIELRVRFESAVDGLYDVDRRCQTMMSEIEVVKLQLDAALQRSAAPAPETTRSTPYGQTG